ncbi:MAG TPA: aminodeoxychorismate/anthranilate synthase component II [Thermoanaerobaculia bacterium]|nr:aminodeoxychorismate/anthranilate synthase component II [Thermoanaerobaculia bacterium]
MILMVDNYDSFTYNLVQMLTAAKAEILVLRNDAESAEAMLARNPEGIVLSPGPGRPEDAGVCLDILRSRADVPILGVCLGHQAMGVAFGSVVDRAPRQMHGKTSMVRHEDLGVFAGLPNPFEATRYHSLEVKQDTLTGELQPIAWAEDDHTLMGLRHRELPYWGVQFHPESVLTGAGPHLLANFLQICREHALAPEEAVAHG